MQGVSLEKTPKANLYSHSLLRLAWTRPSLLAAPLRTKIRSPKRAKKIFNGHQLAPAGRLIGATMHEVNNRLAALTNLVFLARALPNRSLTSTT